jgi:hypothetical protein
MAEMKKKHGDQGGEREFYATANARKEKPSLAGIKRVKGRRK